MGKKILIGFAAVVAGWLAGSVAMSLAHAATMLIWPLPEGLSFQDMFDPAKEKEVHAFIESLPAGAHIAAAVCHWIGTAAGAAVAMLVAGRSHIWPALAIGAIFLLGGIMNALSLPTPAWFLPLDAIGYPVVAWLVGRKLLRAPGSGGDAASA